MHIDLYMYAFYLHLCIIQQTWWTSKIVFFQVITLDTALHQLWLNMTRMCLIMHIDLYMYAFYLHLCIIQQTWWTSKIVFFQIIALDAALHPLWLNMTRMCFFLNACKCACIFMCIHVHAPVYWWVHAGWMNSNYIIWSQDKVIWFNCLTFKWGAFNCPEVLAVSYKKALTNIVNNH